MYWNLQIWSVLCALVLTWCPPTVCADTAEDQYAVAARHYSAARWELAVEEFRAFLGSYPDHARAEAVTFFLAESLMQLDRWDDARVQFERYAQRSPAGKYARQTEFRLGEACYLAGRPKEARESLERFCRAYSDDELCAYALPYLGDAALTLGDAAAAKAAFAEALQRFPDGPLSGECRYGMARALQALGDRAGAVQFYEFLAQQGTASPLADDAALQLAVLQYDDGQFAAAVTSLRNLADRFPGSEVLPRGQYWLGMSQLALEDYPAAAATLEAALARFATSDLAPAIAFSAADAYRRAGQPAKAQPLFERILQQWPTSQWADDSLQLLVQMALEADDDQRVTALADRFFEEYSPSPLRPQVQQTLARAYLKRQQFDAAIELLERLLAGNAAAALAKTTDAAPTADPAAGCATDPAHDATVKYYLALAYLGAGRYEDSLGTLDALTATRQSAELVRGVQVARASALVGLGRFADAVAPLQEFLAAHPEGPDGEKCRAQLTVALASLDRWSDAEPLLAELRQSHADSATYASTLEYVAEAAYSAERTELAESLFQELVDNDYSSASVARGLSGLAWLKWRAKDGATQSAAAFQELLQRFPDSPLAAEAALMRGQALEKAGAATDAAAMYRLVMDRYGDSPHASVATLSLARIYDALAQDHDAELLLRAWLDTRPDAPERDAATYQLAWTLLDQGRDQEAAEAFARIEREFRGSRYWADATYRLAERAARAGDRERADALAGEIADAEPQGTLTSYALFLRGQLAAADQRWDDVERWMKRLVADFPHSDACLPAQYWLAEVRYRQKDYTAAGRLLEELAAATPGRHDAWLAMIALRRAQVKAHAGQWDEAYELARAIAEQFPDFAQQHEVDYLLGRYYMNQAEFDKAREAYQRVVVAPTGATTETAAMAQWMIGETYFMQQQYHQAIKAYHRVESLYSYAQWQAVALLQAGKCHEMLGQWDEAAKLYGQIMKDYAKTSVADKAALRLRTARQKTDQVHTR
jgi:cellulose synthase operon protein C